MRIILLTGDGLEHVYVANKLAAQVPLDGIVVDHGRRFSFFIHIYDFSANSMVSSKTYR